MRQLRISIDEVMEALRQNSIASVADVRYGILEPNGQLSYVLYPQAQPVTAGMLNLSPSNAGVPLVVIAEGKVISASLNRLHLTEDDILQKLRKSNIPRISDVFLMTLDDCGNQFIQKKEA